MACEERPSKTNRQFELKTDTAMKTNSINHNGCSVCERGQENYVKCIADAFRGRECYQYDYRDWDGTLFSIFSVSLEECRRRRDEWLAKKQ